MRIQIFVVKSEKPNATILEQLRKSLVKMFYGLTVVPDATGYWINDKGKIVKDAVELWEIVTTATGYNHEEFTDIIGQIKAVTKQSVQAVEINNDISMYVSPHEKNIIKVLLA